MRNDGWTYTELLNLPVEDLLREARFAVPARPEGPDLNTYSRAGLIALITQVQLRKEGFRA